MKIYRFFIPMCLALLAAFTFSGAFAAPEAKLTLTVNTTKDSVDKHPGDGVCADKKGLCSLRAAIMEGNKHGGKIAIKVPAGHFGLKIAGMNEDLAKKGDLDITKNMTLTGASASKTVIDGAHIDRVFHIFASNVVISNVTIENGLFASPLTVDLNNLGGAGVSINQNAGLTLKNVLVSQNTSGVGGGIFNAGVLAMSMSVVDANHVTDNYSDGGGIANIGTVTLDHGSITNNTANNSESSGTGGGIYNINYGETVSLMTITNSTIANNTAQVEAGGIDNLGSMVMVNSTVTGNTATRGGGIYQNSGLTLNLANVTIAGNHATENDSDSGGIYVQNGTVNWKNTIIATNTDGDGSGNCSGVLVSQDYNLMTETTGCVLQGTQDHDLIGLTEAEAKLGLPANNGGTTMTIALLPGSLGIDRGNPAGCTDFTNTAITTDQRDSVRPVDGDGQNGAQCDIGAFEYKP